MKEEKSGFSTKSANGRKPRETRRNKNKVTEKKEEEEREREQEMVREGKVNLNAVFWNVAGTAGLKSDDRGYLRGFEIIGLVETWEEVGNQIRPFAH